MAEATPASRRPLILAAIFAVLTTIALLPMSSIPIGPTNSFVPAMLSVVACFDFLAVYLLLGDYRDRGDVRLLMMCWAYVWSLIVMGGYALAFPGVLTGSPPLAVTASTASYLYVAWHGGFPVLLGAAWAPWPSRWTAPTPAARRRPLATSTLALAALTGGLVVALISTFSQQLPVLIHGLDTSRMTELTAPLTMPLVVLALASGLHGSRRRSGPERWSIVAILVCLCDLTLTYYSGSRFSLGWYIGRSLTLLSSAGVLMAMLIAFQGLKSRAEHEAAYDALTGLVNRRSVYESLDQMIANCRRSKAPLSVISLDLDLFKHINDRYGHDAGDTVLASVGPLLIRTCRRGDVVARVGGEEFLILLPDTDGRGALVLAEKIRAQVEIMPVPAIKGSVTASLGATAFRADDLTTTMLLKRVDEALYQAKQLGRNRAVLAAPPAALALQAAAG
jgi:diguanylate cyclase (GGDEF)-like protein